jgi:hypothetical protein
VSVKKSKSKVKSKRKIESKGKIKIKSKSKDKSETTGKSGTQGGKSKETTKRPAEKDAPETKERVDIVKVRESIANLVGASAEIIATQVIEVAKSGQLAPAKYLFEMAGLYPATEETAAKSQGDTLAHTLLRRLGLPTEPGGEGEAARTASANEFCVSALGGEEQRLNAEVAEKGSAEVAESRRAGQAGSKDEVRKDTVE